MNTYLWNTLTERKKQLLLARPKLKTHLTRQVKKIITRVKRDQDKALFQLTKELDNVNLSNLRVTEEEFRSAYNTVQKDELNAMMLAKKNIEKYHNAQLYPIDPIQITNGVTCERQLRPIKKVGLYVPGGSAPLVSTVLMLGVPAKLAGCSSRILCSPPNQTGEINPAILVAASLCGIDEVYKLGGAQAIAAMAYGTSSIPKVDKIYGPGNSWVTQAKQIVSQDPKGAAIDMPAGPSELLIIADESANPEFVAADLLSQAEHGEDSQVILIALSNNFARLVKIALDQQIKVLPRKNIITKALKNSRFIVVETLEEAMNISNLYAPEHLILQFSNPEKYLVSIENAGAVFLGQWTPETLGDYVTGSNHVLPTYGYAKTTSGLSILDFMKWITFQNVTKTGLNTIGPAAEILAKIEGLDAHKNAVTLRLSA